QRMLADRIGQRDGYTRKRIRGRFIRQVQCPVLNVSLLRGHAEIEGATRIYHRVRCNRRLYDESDPRRFLRCQREKTLRVGGGRTSAQRQGRALCRQTKRSNNVFETASRPDRLAEPVRAKFTTNAIRPFSGWPVWKREYVIDRHRVDAQLVATC